MNFTKHQRALPAIPTEIAIHVSVLDSPCIKNALKLEEDLAHIRLWIFVVVVWNACTLLSIIKEKAMSGGRARASTLSSILQHINHTISTCFPSIQHYFHATNRLPFFSLCTKRTSNKKRQEKKVKKQQQKERLGGGRKSCLHFNFKSLFKSRPLLPIHPFFCVYVDYFIRFFVVCFHHIKLT